MTTNYTDSLTEVARERYIRKLQCLYNSDKEKSLEELDPFRLVDADWSDDTTRWPPVEYPDIYTYLIETPGEYTREKLKAYKSLEAYNYYQR